MFKYAQIDAATGRCVSVSYLSGEIESTNMIPLTEADDVKPGDIRNADGTWTRPAPVPPQPSRIDQLEADNLTLMEAVADLYEMIIGGGTTA
ncbi:hypothetical protein [Paenibacillus abyssi]|uniref:Uncharacterized protein n=1 Tax=Paenibacillus abyssi TaxID=1340531 RepID=A0A917CGZ5_9BACL|nr:hypothetical protein [Paenibacillus abyssi]GGF88567.1 hypothetical protein GCM10010916_02390 [Paenibacillus abyssi]